MTKKTAKKNNQANKTQASNANVSDFLDQIVPIQKQTDCLHLLSIFQQTTKLPPVLWGTSIIGFGQYHYRYDSGREGDFFMIGFAPRKQNIVIYIMSGFECVHYLLETLGKFKTGKSCLYINKLKDIDEITLKTLISTSFEQLKLKQKQL